MCLESATTKNSVYLGVPKWSNRCGSESSTLETDVYVWRYALLVVHEGKEEDSSVGECTGPTSTDDLGAGNKRTSEVPGQRCSSSRVTCWKAWRAPVTCGEQVRTASLVVGLAAGSQVSWSSSRQSWSRHSCSSLSSQTQHTRLKHTNTQTRRLYIQTDTTQSSIVSVTHRGLYSVSQKKSPLRFSEIFSQTVGNF